MTPTATAEAGTAVVGRVARVTGPVVDIEFPHDSIPDIYNALKTTIVIGEESTEITLEVAQHLGDDLVRAIALKPTDGIVRGQEVEALRQALGTLPPAYREAVILCDLQELSYQDAAVAAGCAIGTVRSRLHRGRQILAARMRGERRAFAGWPAAEWL
jgi:RNA polymerase sigma factor (sigma-70 family)